MPRFKVYNDKINWKLLKTIFLVILLASNLICDMYERFYRDIEGLYFK